MYRVAMIPDRVADTIWVMSEIHYLDHQLDDLAVVVYRCRKLHLHASGALGRSPLFPPDSVSVCRTRDHSRILLFVYVLIIITVLRRSVICLAAAIGAGGARDYSGHMTARIFQGLSSGVSESVSWNSFQ